MSTLPQGPEESRGPEHSDLSGKPVVDRNGSKLGTLEHVYLAPDSGSPTWGVVRAGRKHRFVPLYDARSGTRTVRVDASKQQVRTAPNASADQELNPEFEGRLVEHYTGEANTARASVVSMRRSRGVMSGLVLVLLGVWTGLVPFVGPYFGYGFGGGQPWVFTVDRLWLCVLPAAAILVGGLVMIPASNRFLAGTGGVLALAGGVWLLVGPSLSRLWGTEGVATPIGSPLGSPDMWVWAQLGFFFASGALATILASVALGRMSVRSVRD